MALISRVYNFSCRIGICAKLYWSKNCWATDPSLVYIRVSVWTFLGLCKNMHCASKTHHQNSAINPFVAPMFQFSLGDVLSCCTVDLPDHPAVSLRSRSQCPGLDSGVQSPWVRRSNSCLPAPAMSLSHDPCASPISRCSAPCSISSFQSHVSVGHLPADHSGMHGGGSLGGSLPDTIGLGQTLAGQNAPWLFHLRNLWLLVIKLCSCLNNVGTILVNLTCFHWIENQWTQSGKCVTCLLVLTLAHPAGVASFLQSGCYDWIPDRACCCSSLDPLSPQAAHIQVQVINWNIGVRMWTWRCFYVSDQPQSVYYLLLAAFVFATCKGLIVFWSVYLL